MADDGGEKMLLFHMQIGLVRESVAIEGKDLTVHTLKDIACAFVDRKVSIGLLEYVYSTTSTT